MMEMDYEVINIGDYYNISTLVAAYAAGKDKRVKDLIYKLLELEAVHLMKDKENMIKEMEALKRREQIKNANQKE